MNLLFKRTRIHNDSYLSKHAFHPLHSLNRDGRCNFFENWNSKRQKKLLVTLPGTTAKGITWVFLIALHISAVLSKAVLKFYNFDNSGREKKKKKVYLNTFVLPFSLIFPTFSLCRCKQSRLKVSLVNRAFASLCFIFPEFWHSRYDKLVIRNYFCLMLVQVL